MLSLVRWCIAHRRVVVLAWIVLVIGVTAIAQSAGRQYANNFTLPGTDSQRASDLLSQRFPTQSGDLDTIVWHVASGTATDGPTQAVVAPMLARVSHLANVVGVVSPFGARGRAQVSADHRTAFANVLYDKRANLLPKNAGSQLLSAMGSAKAPGLSLAAGGQAVEQAESSGVGPATAVGVVAALLILLLTFGSLLTAGMPLIVAGFGLITGVGLIGLMTHVIQTTNIAPELAVMIGLGVGIDYALFIVTRFRQAYTRRGDANAAVLEAMDTSGRAIVLAGATVIIALLGMFTLGVSFLNGMALAAALAVALTLLAALTVLPALLSRFGDRIARGGRILGRAHRRRAEASGAARPAEGSAWRRWALTIQRRPWLAAGASIALMVAFALPVTALRLDNSDASNDPPKDTSHQAYALLASGFGQGFNGPLSIVAQLPATGQATGLSQLNTALRSTGDVAAVLPARLSPDGTVAVVRVYPASAPEALATTNLVNTLRNTVLPPVEHQTGLHVLVGGFTAGSIDFSSVLAHKLPLFIGVVVLLSALLLLVIFRSLVIPLQAAVMNLLSIGGALGVVTAIFQWGWLGGLFGVKPGPIEAFVPVLMFAIVFGLSMDYEVFLISRIHEEWVRQRDPSAAVRDGLTFTGRVITAAAAIMVCVFGSFMLGGERVLKEFGLGLAGAVFLDALVVRCLMLPAVLQLLGSRTWWLPGWLDRLLPRVRIEGTMAGLPPDPETAAASEAREGVSAS
jgi:RND superfamily putative drug exporter